MSNDNRKHPRVDILNLVSYDCIDDDGNHALQGMGRILDISRGASGLKPMSRLNPGLE
ncbi:MAG: hypothetical protein U9O82_06145 [Thermodesulfobacteriota bacterium]|nr:hypothetical protein [Thermodesulfobacteriota bacterium]